MIIKRKSTKSAIAITAGILLAVGAAAPAMAEQDTGVGGITCGPANTWVYIYSTTTGRTLHLHVSGSTFFQDSYAGTSALKSHASDAGFRSEGRGTVTSVTGTISSASEGCDEAGQTY